VEARAVGVGQIEVDGARCPRNVNARLSKKKQNMKQPVVVNKAPPQGKRYSRPAFKLTDQTYSKTRKNWHCNVRDVKLQETYKKTNSDKVVISGLAPKTMFNKNKKRKDNSQWSHLPKKHYKKGKQGIFEFDLAKATLHRISRKMSKASDTDEEHQADDKQADGNTYWLYTKNDIPLPVNLREFKQKCLTVVGKDYNEKKFYELCSQLGNEKILDKRTGPDREKYTMVGYNLDRAEADHYHGRSQVGFSCCVMRIKKEELWEDQSCVIQLKRKRISRADTGEEVSPEEAAKLDIEFRQEVTFEPPCEALVTPTMGFVFKEFSGKQDEWSATASYGNNTKLVETFRKEETMRNFLRTKFITHKVQGVDGDVHVTSARVIEETENLVFWDPVYAASATPNSPIKFLMGVFEASGKIDKSRAKNVNVQPGMQTAQHILDVETMSIEELASYYDPSELYIENGFYEYANKGEKILFPTEKAYFDKVKVWHKLILKAKKALEIIDILRGDHGENRAGLVTYKMERKLTVIMSNLENPEVSPVEYIECDMDQSLTDVFAGDIVLVDENSVVIEVLRPLPPVSEREKSIFAVDFNMNKFPDRPFYQAHQGHGRSIRQQKEEEKPKKIVKFSKDFQELKNLFHKELSEEFQEDIAFYIAWYEVDGKKRHTKGKTKWKLENLTPPQLQDYLMGKPPHFPKSWKISFPAASISGKNEFPLKFINGEEECWSMDEYIMELDFVEVAFANGKDIVKAKGWDPKQLWRTYFHQNFEEYFQYDMKSEATCMHKDINYD